ncbi:MAG: acylphosphatase [Methanomicrobiaceae archaeon]|nr:acylphosphatase [Methanomicrobiaceae archaeon]
MVREEEENDLTEGNSPKFRTIEAYINGRVQGVGFRACVRKIASHLSVTGEVMNLEDGRVCIIATAEDIIIDKFISSLYECPRAHIRDIHIYEKELREFPDFSIVRIY